MKNIYIALESPRVNSLGFRQVRRAMESGKEIIHTSCLDFFSFETLDKGYEVTMYEPLPDGLFAIFQLSKYLDKDHNRKVGLVREIRKAHNMRKMFVAGALPGLVVTQKEFSSIIPRGK